ncbi:hypothetical protein GCM10020221_34770 [Streptomyces thioluteus]|uniref:Peptidase M14 domain-containing protein n=1 Tax=Streptomyces thioluteus TaxID=66431 RepID=A0ABN3X4G4_STRTU
MAASLLIGGVTAAPFAHARPDAPTGPAASDAVRVWDAKVTSAQMPLLLKAGVDGHELGRPPAAGRAAPVELYLTGRQADELRGQGVELTERHLSQRARERFTKGGDGVFRRYSGENGLQREIVNTGIAHPGLTKVVNIGKSLRGQDMLAIKISKDASRTRDGSRPAVLYMSNQHAREWITPEMTRRLMHHYLNGYGKDRRITRIVDSTELWFVLSANPDGYDYTFKGPDTRLWRKNLRDNNGDGKIAPGDGVDLNRNFPYKWGYDNEGSSADPASETYRGKGPASEPETRVLDAFEKRMRFRYAINYHSAAELLLYGVGWQVATPTPDDVLYKALAGTPGEVGDPRLPAAALLRAVHHQRRGRRPRGQRQRDDDVHPGDVDVPDGLAHRHLGPLEPRRLPLQLQLPGRREADPGGVHQEHPLRPLRRRDRGPRRPARPVRRPHGPGLHPGRLRRLLRPRQ